jgi:hypothetical protein
MNDPKRMVMMVWAAFLCSPLIQCFVLHEALKVPEKEFGGQMTITAAPFQAVAAIIALLALVVWRTALKPEALRKAGSGEPAIRGRWIATHIGLYVLAESVSLIGFMLGWLFREPSLAYGLFGSSVILIAIMFPSTATLETALKDR